MRRVYTKAHETFIDGAVQCISNTCEWEMEGTL